MNIFCTTTEYYREQLKVHLCMKHETINFFCSIVAVQQGNEISPGAATVAEVRTT